MNAPIKDGGPAFPHHETTPTGELFHDHLGMTLRDWFAGQALAGILATGFGRVSKENPAVAAYFVADAMIAERVKQPDLKPATTEESK